MATGDRKRDRKFQLWGWILFLVCAAFFIASSIQGSNIPGITGSVIFLAGCVVFIIPLVIKGKPDEDS